MDWMSWTLPSPGKGAGVPSGCAWLMFTTKGSFFDREPT
jgi:hypothetical protein